MRIRVERREQVAASIRSRRKRHAQGVERGIKRAARFLLRESLKIVPVDTGALKNSGRATFTGSGTETVGTVSYNTAYAVYVHEDLNARHAPGKTAKYLERPARELRGKLMQIVAEEVRKQ